MFLAIPDSNRAQRIKQLFSDCSYNERTLARAFGHISPVFLDHDEQGQAAAGIDAPPDTRTLLELFFLEKAVARKRFEASLSDTARADLLAAGLVVEDGGDLVASVLLVPVGDLLIAGDRYQKMPAEMQAEHVLSVNPPARLLANFTVRKPVSRLLDLCAGNGIQALAASASADEVIATDLNPRALKFSAFNAALNGIGNIESRCGAGFAPVAGEKFDQIVCNPPYILTPEQRYMCTDNTMALDGFCKSLLDQAPAFLEEGGLLQMICEWVETEKQGWRERLSEWFVGNHCDAWVICSGYSSVAEYVTRRSQQTLADPEAKDSSKSSDWLAYFRSHGVTGIRSGFIQLRRRQGKNWRSFTSLGERTRGAVGDSIAAGLVWRDRYLGLADARVLDLRPRPVADLSELPAQQAAPGSARLVIGSGLPVSFLASPGVRSMLRAMDGTRSVADVCDTLARQAGVPLEHAQAEGCSVVRELLSQGLLGVPDTAPS